MLRARHLALTALLFLICISTAVAQDRNAVDALAAPELLEEAVARMNVVTELGDARVELLDQERALRTEIDRLTLDLQGLHVPTPPRVAEPPVELSEAQSLIDQLSARSEALATRESLLTTQLSLLEEHQDAALRLAQESELMRQALAAAQPFIDEIDNRVEVGEIASEDDLATVDGLSVRMTQAGLADDIERWRAVARRADLQIDASENALDEVGEAQALEAPGIAQAELWLQEATVRNTVREEWNARTVGEIVAGFNSQVVDFEITFQELNQRIRESDQRANAVEAAENRIETLVEPLPAEEEETADGSLVPTVRLAQRNLALSESAATFYERRHEELEALQGHLIDSIETDQALAGRLETAVAEAMQLDVLTELLRERDDASAVPDEVRDADFAEQLRELRETRARVTGRVATFSERIDAVTEEIVRAQNNLIEARETVSDRQAALAREEDWASYISDLQAEDSDALIEIFERTDAAFDEANGHLNDAAVTVDRTMARVADAESAYIAHVDPAALEMRERRDEFDQWLADQGLRIEEPPAAEETAQAAGDAAPDTATAPADEAAAAAPPTQVEIWLQTLRYSRDNIAVRRSNFYGQEQELRDLLIVQLEADRLALGNLLDAATLALDQARRAWGAANILTVRQRREEIDADAMPEAVERWADRELLEGITVRVEEAQQQVERIDFRLTNLQDRASSATFVDPLQLWQQNLATRIEELSDYQSLRSQFDAIGNPEALDDLESQLLERSIQARIANDLGVYEVLGDFFATSETETIDELLHRYYERLVQNENRVGNIDQRRGLIERLIEQAQTSREALEPLQAAIAQELERYQRDLQVETVRVLAALNPADAPELLAELSETALIDLDPSTIPTLPRGADEETMRVARNELISALIDDWARMAGYQLWAAQVQAELEPLGGIDRQVGELEDLSANLDSSRSDVERSIGRLVGFSPQELQSLIEADTGVQPEDRQRLASGEIGTLQQQRRGIIDSTAIQAVIALIIIPVIAVMVILISRLIGGRIVNRVERKKGAEKGAKERAVTLNGIFQTVVLILTTALAVIYMLSAVNIDVAPLLASLGIFGLAVAFGAQAIIKDVFSGFFLLFENQLNKGDWVVINGVMGEVEDIGLRITKLREWSSGKLHYFPNGQFDHVANWTKGYWRHLLTIRVPFGIDPDRPYEIMNAVVQEVKAEPAFAPVIRDMYAMKGVYDIDYDRGSFVYVTVFEINGSAQAMREYVDRLARRFKAAGIPWAVPVTMESEDRSVLSAADREVRGTGTPTPTPDASDDLPRPM